ncbi:thioredoxin family protein [Algoriphagus yeomjeoni]|uniref:Uncharacterized protein n=1 Tax=Algoriphagus yeomjeoni TaxID=291403 RepID=A0A327P011_9BACT|nr:hypothetical protein [Algoriphagus yeomjeoni]RAI85570.1 hypothetical protein LV83_03650 [Algoriphagus yeomjeoni]
MEKNPDKTRPISYEEAAILISNIEKNKNSLGNHPVLNNNAGGTFRADSIEHWVFDDEVKGLMCWYCLAGNDFFIAIEPLRITYEETDILNRRPIADQLLVPKKLLKENLYNRDDLPTELPRFKDGVAARQRTQTREIVNTWIGNYKTFMEANGFPQYSPYSFFVGMDGPTNYLRDFFQKKNPRNLRYFFSYDPNDAPYSIRVILAPVNQLGRNIHFRTGKLKSFDDVLQYSWPPKT